MSETTKHNGPDVNQPNPLDADLRTKMEALHTDSYGWALACCGHDSHEAKDVLQTAYLKVLRGEARFAGRAQFKTWLFGVIRLTALDSKRRGGRWRGILGRLLGEPREFSTTRDPRRETERRERSEVLEKSLAALPARQREVLHLVFYQGMTLAEAAETLGISAGSAAQHFARGKERLRRMPGIPAREGGGP